MRKENTPVRWSLLLPLHRGAPGALWVPQSNVAQSSSGGRWAKALGHRLHPTYSSSPPSPSTQIVGHGLLLHRQPGSSGGIRSTELVGGISEPGIPTPTHLVPTKPSVMPNPVVGRLISQQSQISAVSTTIEISLEGQIFLTSTATFSK